MDEDLDYKLYVIAELRYKEVHENDLNKADGLFPEGWYLSKNYKLKTEIIAEAIRNNTTITKTPKYQEFIEGLN